MAAAVSRDLQERGNETVVLNGSNACKVCGKRETKDTPPLDPLASDVLVQAPEKDKKGQLDRPQTRIKQGDHRDGCSQV